MRPTTRPSQQSDDDISLLIACGIAAPLISEALPEAGRLAVPVHRVLLANGMTAADSYVERLAQLIGPGVVTWRAVGRVAAPDVAIDATSPTPSEVRRLCHAALGRGLRPVLMPARRMGYAEGPRVRRQRLIEATNGLRRRNPLASAGIPTPDWQRAAAVGLVGAVIGGLIVAPQLIATVLLGLVAIPFFCIVVLRVSALVLLIAGNRPSRPPAAVADAELPTYAVLVPLFREGPVVADLVQALARLDYPAAKLDVVLALEASDIESRAAVELLDLPAFIRSVVVPDAQPRTKPKALNFALAMTTGEMVVVFDAEDIPDPDQLRRAVALMRGAGRPVGCVQARLAIDNDSESFLSRQFALEYRALFDALLPALSRMGIPVPLGGTSNHFPRHVIESVGGWDPFNVTEDAELGMRLARRRLPVLVLDSTTWEEAPIEFGVWLRQRTRWIKGWIQTWLVQMRDQLACAREMGLGGFIGLQVLMGGLVLSALMHPLFYIILASELMREQPFAGPSDGIGAIVWYIAIFNLAAGYLSAMALAAIAAIRQRQWRLALAVPAMPIYWLLISIAAYRAVIQLMYAPHLWEKTTHGSRGRSAAARRPSPRAHSPA